MKGIFPIDKFRTLQTPFYYYDTKVLRKKQATNGHSFAVLAPYSKQRKGRERNGKIGRAHV